VKIALFHLKTQFLAFFANIFFGILIAYYIFDNIWILTMKMTFHIKIDPCSLINLSADFFHTSSVRFSNPNELEIRLEQNNLSALIKKKMECMLKFAGHTFFKGTIKKVIKENRFVTIICQLPDYPWLDIPNEVLLAKKAAQMA
jgi:hypothetical protein